MPYPPEPQPEPVDGTVPHAAERFGHVPNGSETVGTIPQDAERFRTLRNDVERKENHTLTVRETARLFEAAGVARTERSIVNWCQANRTGVARLDAYFDPNEHRYFITPESVDQAIAEEKAKAAKAAGAAGLFGTVPNDPSNGDMPSGPARGARPSASIPQEADPERVHALEQEVMDLKITNRGKDYFIGQLKHEREAFAQERQTYVDRLLESTRKVGELETKLLQLESPSRRKLNDGDPGVGAIEIGI